MNQKNSMDFAIEICEKYGLDIEKECEVINGYLTTWANLESAIVAANIRADLAAKYAALVKATEDFLKDAEANNLPEPKCKCTACRAIPRFKTALAALKECHDTATTEG